MRQFGRFMSRLAVILANQLMLMVHVHLLSRIAECSRRMIYHGMATLWVTRGLVLACRMVIHVMTSTTGAIPLSAPRSLDHVALFFVVIVHLAHMAGRGLLVVVLHLVTFLALFAQADRNRLSAGFNLGTMLRATMKLASLEFAHRLVDSGHHITFA